MRDIQKRIDAIQRKAEQIIEARARYEPFSTVRVQSVLTDKADVVFWPSGLYGDKEVSAPMTIFDAIQKAKGAKRFVSMEFCPELRHAFLMTSPLYSDEQKANFKERDLHDYPSVAAIYDDPNPEECISFLSKIPQSFRLRKE